MSKYPKLHSILRCRYRICKKLGSTVDGNDDLEAKVFCVLVRVSKSAKKLCLESRNPSCKPRLSGPSIRRTIAGSCQCSNKVDLRSKVCKFR